MNKEWEAWIAKIRKSKREVARATENEEEPTTSGVGEEPHRWDLGGDPEWVAAFDRDPKVMARRVVDGRTTICDPRTRHPEGTLEYWKGIYGDKSKSGSTGKIKREHDRPRCSKRKGPANIKVTRTKRNKGGASSSAMPNERGEPGSQSRTLTPNTTGISTSPLIHATSGTQDLTRVMRKITYEDISRHIANKKNLNTAAGPDSLSDLDLMAEDRGYELAAWFCLFLYYGDVPCALKRFNVTLLPKTDAPQGPGDMRPIAVGSSARRLFSGILHSRIRSEGVATHPCQKGFEEGVDGCATLNFALTAIVRDRARQGRAVHFVLVDVRKAFDSVSHKSLGKAMTRAGIQGRLNTLIDRMFTANVLSIRDPVTGEANEIRPGRGVAQGDPLSPLLFNLVMDMIVEESGILSSEGGGVQTGPGLRDRRAEAGPSGDLGGARVTHLMYADDLVLLAESCERLQTDLLRLEEAMGKHGLAINASKSSALHVDGEGGITQPEKALRMGDGTVIPTLGDLDVTRYLGVNLVGGGLKTDGGLARRQKLTAALDNISNSPLTPRQRVRCLRQVAIPRQIHELTLEPGNNAALRGNDELVLKYLRDWLGPDDVGEGSASGGSPAFCLRAQAHSKYGLGVMNLSRRIPRIQERKLLRIAERAAADPEDQVLGAVVSSEQWGAQIQALIERERSDDPSLSGGGEIEK